MSVENRKNEVTELRNLLDSPSVESDSKKRVEALKRVIEAMTLGIDLSPLFSKLIMMASSRDPVEKKLVYLYLCNYAESSPDLAMLVVNTLLKDCSDGDPATRGFALRQLCNLRASTVIEYIHDPIKTGLTDRSSYVRRTAVLGTLRLFKSHAQNFDHVTFVPALFSRLSDADPQVQVNAVIVLSEIYQSWNKPLPLPRNCIVGLLNNITNLPCFLQAIVLELTSLIQPKDDEELFALLNIVDSCLDNYENCAVLLAAAHVMIQLTRNRSDLIDDVISRVSEPLLHIINDVDKPEMSIIALSHVKSLVNLSSTFSTIPVLKHFLLRRFDSLCAAKLKVKILAQAALRSDDISVVEWTLEELGALLYHPETEIATSAVQSINLIGCRRDELRHRGIRLFAELLGDSTALANSTLSLEPIHFSCCVALRQLVSITDLDSDNQGFIVSLVCRLLSFNGGSLFIKENNKNELRSEAFIAFIWLLGHFAELIPESAYLLEQFATPFVFNSLNFISQYQLINSTISVFLKHKARCAPVIKAIFSLGNTSTFSSIRTRVGVFSRLIKQKDLENLELVIRDDQEEYKLLSEVDYDASMQKLEDFNSIKLIDGHNQNAVSSEVSGDSEVVKLKSRIRLVESFEFNQIVQSISGSENDEYNYGQGDENNEVESDLLTFEGVSKSEIDVLQLLSSIQISPQQFQSWWGSYSGELIVKKSIVHNYQNEKSVVSALQDLFENKLKIIASGMPNNAVKIFFAVSLNERPLLCQLDITGRTLALTSKFEGGLDQDYVAGLLEEIIL
ncbi:hypothetical protein P9112_008269 [Eukaryota sp. TZLM1-RC]